MAVIAPWLQPPDFLGASEAGYRLGLSRQQMLEQADEHAAELSLRADEQRQRASEANANRAQDQNQFNAGQALRQEALRQQGLLGGERIGNEQARIGSTDELNQAKISALRQKPVIAGMNASVKNASLQNLPDLMAAYPEMTKAEILGRFPMLSASDIPARPRIASAKPLLPPGVQDALFKQLLANSTGKTNVDEAMAGLQKYMQPPIDVESTVTPSPEPSAGESLTAPTAESVDGLNAISAPAPALAQSGVTIRDNATGKTFIYRGDPKDIPADKYSVIQ